LWLTTLAWAALIFYLSTGAFGGSLSGWLLREFLRLCHIDVSTHTFSTLHFLLRKLAHLTEYAVFSLLLYGCFGSQHQFKWRTRTAWWCLAVAGAYGFTDEFHQLFVPGRTASLLDCGIDGMGAALGLLGLYLVGSERFFQANSSRATAKIESMVEK